MKNTVVLSQTPSSVVQVNSKHSVVIEPRDSFNNACLRSDFETSKLDVTVYQVMLVWYCVHHFIVLSKLSYSSSTLPCHSQCRLCRLLFVGFDVHLLRL